MPKIIRHTRSVCPVCLITIPAVLKQHNNAIYMEKECPEHGSFSVPIWRNMVELDTWCGPMPEMTAEENLNCPHGCGICADHLQGSCCVLLEVTQSCNLHCRYCFANEMLLEPSMEELQHAVDIIMRDGKNPLLQLSGGEPTMRDDLPELIAYAKERGCKYIQLNSNGLRLAQDENYLRSLVEAGLSFVFMQFDGTNDEIYQVLRGAPLFEQKLRAIELCNKYSLGVTLVPTIVRGVNEHQIGDIIRLGASLSPAVRGVHFQPVSYFGRYPKQPEDENRYTLDELLHAFYAQAGITPENILPSRCDHPLCGCHGSFIVLPEGELHPLSHAQSNQCCCTTAEQNREYVARHWKRSIQSDCCSNNEQKKESIKSLDGFLKRVKKYSFTITAMAFQDSMNLNIERLRRCSLHVYSNGKLKPFCAHYLTAIKRD